jgi:RNA polymerase sigma-54 factor
MILTPQLRQRIEMLQMTAMELQDLIEQEMVANPILEEVTPGEEIGEISDNILDQNSDGHDDGFETRNAELNGNLEASREGAFDEYETIRADISTDNGVDVDNPMETGSSDDGVSDSGDSTDAFEEIDYGREFQEYLDPGYKTQEIEYKEDAPSFEQFLTSKPSLSDHLEWQLSMTDLTDAQERAAIAVIGNLDEDGRLTADIETIATLGECSIDRAEEARHLVMNLEPVGCGAKDVRECLLVQLEAAGHGDSLASTLVRDHLEDLQPHRLQHLSKATGIDVHELNEEINKVRVLDPYPGRRYSSDDAVFVAPEVYIEKLEDEYVIYFTDDGSPRLRISPSLQNMLSQEDTTRETKDFIKEKMRSAVDLLRNIEHRRQTIYRVVECIVKRQTEFLDKGVEFIKPMMLKDVAEDIGMHLSTISRVVNRKYAHTPQGVIELRRFFSEGMMNEEGEEVSTRILKLKIKKMIEEEDTKKPLTDDQIAKILSKEGVKLSRRTVAKYRDQMNIPGSRERKTVI